MLHRSIDKWFNVLFDWLTLALFAFVTLQGKVSEPEKSCTNLGAFLKVLAKSEKKNRVINGCKVEICYDQFQVSTKHETSCKIGLRCRTY